MTCQRCSGDTGEKASLILIKEEDGDEWLEVWCLACQIEKGMRGKKSQTTLGQYSDDASDEEGDSNR